MNAPVAPNPQRVPNWWLTLEQVHGHLEDILGWLTDLLEPPTDLTPIGEKLRESYQHLYALLSLSVDPLDALNALSASLGELEARLNAQGDDPHFVAGVQSCKSALAAAESARPTLSGIHWSGVVPPTPMKASLDDLRLHRIERETILPKMAFAPAPATDIVSATQPRPKPKDFKELRETAASMSADAKSKLGPRPKAEAPAQMVPPPPQRLEGFIADPLPPLTTEEFRRERARDTFEEISMLGLHRTPLLGDPWRSCISFERRLLENLDALVSLGTPGLAELEALTLDAKIKDPARLFALTLVAGCVDGRDTLAVAERYYARERLTDPAFTTAFISALRIVPHPWVVPRCRAMLASPIASLRRVAVEVLGYRQELTQDELHALCLDEPQVMAAALPHFARQDDPRLAELLERGMARCEENPEDVALFKGVATAVAIGDHPYGESFFYRHADGANALYAAWLLGIIATPRIARDLLERVRNAPTAPFVTALSWAGCYDAVQMLIYVLGTSQDEPVRVAAAYGLERLTAAGFYEVAEIRPEKLEEPEIPEPDLGEPPPKSLAGRVSIPQDEPAEASSDLLERPSTDFDRWRRHWEPIAPRFHPDQRIRRGVPYTPLVSLEELDTGRYTPAERRALVVELVVRTGRYIPLDPEDWVTAQGRAITQWQTLIKDSGRAPGSWDRATRRIR
ncbi:MAG: hypothetical protein QM784_39020 [Polyangiaceae bacterium]